MGLIQICKEVGALDEANANDNAIAVPTRGGGTMSLAEVKMPVFVILVWQLDSL